MTSTPIPKAFIWRRTHSLMGLWLVIYLIMHLFTNSQAALLVGDDGRGFIHAVNGIHDLPFLPVLEVLILGVPILIHGLWGIHYIWTAKPNSRASDGSKPALPEYSRNRAYSWQRITSWILLVGILAHVVHMRFLEHPVKVRTDDQRYYMVKLEEDSGLSTLAVRLGIKLYDPAMVKAAEQSAWGDALRKRPIGPGEVIAVATDFGTAELLVVRETFKSPIMMLLYTLLVISACYHAFNGLWTFLISWGIVIRQDPQKWMLRLCTGLMVFVTFLGLAAVWGTYWINLKH